MIRLISFCFFVSLFLISTNSQAQKVKTKTKTTKTKVKPVSTTIKTVSPSVKDTSSMSTTNMAGTQSDYPTLTNTSWMTYFGDPINDTIIIHYGLDSSSVKSKTNGMTLVSSVYKASKDTATFHDLGGVHSCPSDQIGTYRINIKGDVLTLDLIKDDCDGRADALKGIKWQRLKQTLAE